MTTETIDLIELTKQLPNRRRGKACIVLTRDYPQQKPWSEKLADRTGMAHINLLDEMAGLGPDISMGRFSVNGLFKYLENKSETPVLIVSGIEFVKATWSYNPRKSMAQFAQQLEMWSRKPALFFVMQHDPLLTNKKFTRFPDLRFVVDQQNTLSLEI